MVDRIVETQLRFVNDKQAANQVLRDNARIGDSLEDIAGGANKTEQAYTAQEKAAKRAAKAQLEVAEAAIRSAKEQSELVGDVASRTSQLSGALSGLGAIGGQRLMIAADLLDVVEAGKLLRAELPALGKQLVTNAGGVSSLVLQFGTLAAVTGGVVLAYKAVAGAAEDSRKEAEKFIETQRRLRDVITEGLSTDDLQKNIDALRDKNEQLRQDIDVLIAKRDEEAKSLSRLELTGELIGGPFNTGVQTLNDEINSLTGAIDDNVLAIQKYQDALTTERTIIDETTAAITRRYEDEAALQELITSGTVDSIQTRIQSVQDELDAMQRMRDEFSALNRETEGLYASQLDELDANLANLRGELDLLNKALPEVTLAEQVKAYNEAVDKANQIDPEVIKRYNDELKRQQELLETGADALAGVGIPYEAIEKGAQAIADAEAERIKAVEDAEQQILDVQKETAEKRADLIANTERAIADLQAAYAQERADAERDYQETVAAITRDYRDDALKDLQDFQRDERRRLEDHRDAMLDAAGRLDAVALLNEQRNFEKEDKRAKEDFKIEQARRKKEFQQRLKEEEAAFKKEQQQAERAYRERERDLRDSLNRQLADLRTAQNKEIAEIRAHQAQRLATIDNSLEAELRALTGFTQEENTVRGAHYVQMLDALQAFVDEANATVSGLSAGSGGAVGSSVVPNTPGAVGQFPLSAGIRPPSGIASPFASPMAMMPPVGRSMITTSSSSAQITNQFNGMDRLTPGQIRNVVKIVNDEMLKALA